MVFRYFGHVDWVLNPLEKLLFIEMDFEIYSFNKWLRNIVTPRPGRVYSTTTVGAYKSSKCHIVVFWRLK